MPNRGSDLMLADFASFISAGAVEQLASIGAAAHTHRDDDCDDERLRSAAAQVWVQSRRESACPGCRGYGWRVLPTARMPAQDVAARVFVCRCTSGERFWMLALSHPELVRQFMGLDARGAIAEVDGLFGKFSVNGREVRSWRTYRLLQSPSGSALR
jgi:hypothetical protein